MTDREALAAALADDREVDYWAPSKVEVLKAAARERLAQLPEKCEHGETEPHWDYQATEHSRYECPGKVYPAELVKKVALAAFAAWYKDEVYTPGFGQEQSYERIAVAVLDALNETP